MKESIKNAIYQTGIKYGKYQAKYAIFQLLTTHDTEYFTNSEGNGRATLEKIGIEAVEEELINDYLMLVLNSKAPAQNPLEQSIYTTYTKYQRDLRGTGKILQTCLKNILNGNNIFPVGETNKLLLSENAQKLNMTVEEYVAAKISDKIVENLEKEKKSNITNSQIYPSNLNKIRSAVLSGCGLKYSIDNKEARVGNLYAVSNIGRKRKNQEDAALLVEHPDNPEFKMLAVADGMGGLEDGEKASKDTVEAMKKWFESISKDCFNKPEFLQNEITNKLNEISQKIANEKNGRSGSTFVGAIVGKNTTLVINVGDSRAYAVQKDKLIQVTSDQSVAWINYKRGEIKNKDDIRFYKASNIIIQNIGDKREILPEFKVLDNRLFDTLLLTSDGVTDCLSDDRLQAICKNTDRKQLAKAIVDRAVHTDSFARKELKNDPDYVDHVRGGKDNTTVAQYTKDDERN